MVFTSRSLSTLVLTCEAFLQLLFPFAWQCPYFPFLPLVRPSPFSRAQLTFLCCDVTNRRCLIS